MEHLGTVTIEFFVNEKEGKVESAHRVVMETEKDKAFLGLSARDGTLYEFRRFCEEVAKDPNMLIRIFPPEKAKGKSRKTPGPKSVWVGKNVIPFPVGGLGKNKGEK